VVVDKIANQIKQMHRNVLFIYFSNGHKNPPNRLYDSQDKGWNICGKMLIHLERVFRELEPKPGHDKIVAQ